MHVEHRYLCKENTMYSNLWERQHFVHLCWVREEVTGHPEMKAALIVSSRRAVRLGSTSRHGV